MQLLFILAIVFAIGAVGFAFQNGEAVTVTMGYWQFDASLAVIVLVAMAIGALVSGLLCSPKMIAGQVDSTRLRRRVDELERANARLEQRVRDLNERDAVVMRRESTAPIVVERPRGAPVVAGGAR